MSMAFSQLLSAISKFQRMKEISSDPWIEPALCFSILRSSFYNLTCHSFLFPFFISYSLRYFVVLLSRRDDFITALPCNSARGLGQAQIRNIIRERRIIFCLKMLEFLTRCNQIGYFHWCYTVAQQSKTHLQRINFLILVNASFID